MEHDHIMCWNYIYIYTTSGLPQGKPCLRHNWDLREPSRLAGRWGGTPLVSVIYSVEVRAVQWMYCLNASDFQWPSILIWLSDNPHCAAVVAALMQKLWLLKVVGSRSQNCRAHLRSLLKSFLRTGPHGAGFSHQGCLNQAAPPFSLFS